jgi:hypothetical protein
MYLSYAKDIAVAMLKDGKLDDEAYGEVLSAVATGGDVLYEARPDAPKKNPVKDELDEVFGETEDITEEKPWTEPPQLKVS